MPLLGHLFHIILDEHWDFVRRIVSIVSIVFCSFNLKGHRLSCFCSFTVAFIYAALQGAFSVFLFQAEPLSMASRGQFVSFHGSFFVTLLCVLSILMTLSNLPSISMLYDKLYHAYSLLETPKPMYRLLSHDHLVIRAQSRLGQILRQLHATSSWLSFLANAVPIAAVYFFSPSALACSTCPSIVQKWAFYCCSALPLGYWISVWYGGRLMSQAAQEVSDLKKSKYKLKGA